MTASFRFQVSGFKFERRVARFSGIRFGNLKLGTRNPKLIQAGFTLIELIVVISLVGILAVVAADRLLYYQELAEKAAMESVLAGTKMGLQIRMAEMIITNRQSQVIELERENPMRWLQDPPANYAGEYAPPVKPGNWYYAASERELVYVPNGSSYLDTGQAGRKELRYRVAIRYQSDTETGSKSAVGVTLVPVREFRWFSG